MFCSNCGSSNIDGANFCIKCGDSLTGVFKEQNNFGQKPKKMSLIKKIFIGVIVTYIIGIVIVNIQNNSNKNDISDFIDNTSEYKGSTITLDLMHTNPLSTLKDLRGSEVKFTRVRRPTMDIYIYIPSDISTPNARYTDNVSVTFICTEGSLTNGNIAVSFSR